MANQSRVITMSPLIINHEGDLDLDLWEVVNPSDGDYSDDSFSVDTLSDDDVISLDDAPFASPSPKSPPPQTDGGEILDEPPQILHETVEVELAADLDLDGHVDGDSDGDGVCDKDDDEDLGLAQGRMVLPVGITYKDYVDRDGCDDESDEDLDDVDDGDYDDSYDLEEELVPRSVCRKLGRQRMTRKGKRAIAKLFTTKMSSPYSLKNHGFARGKHGLGMKYRY